MLFFSLSLPSVLSSLFLRYKFALLPYDIPLASSDIRNYLLLAPRVELFLTKIRARVASRDSDEKI